MTLVTYLFINICIIKKKKILGPNHRFTIYKKNKIS